MRFIPLSFSCAGSSTKKNKLSQIIRLLTCFLMLSSMAILRDAHFMGYEIIPSSSKKEPITRQADGSLIISTQTITPDIKGYGGAVPLDIIVKEGKILEIQALKNAETPDFFHLVEIELLPKWKGKTMKEAASAEIDGVSGATLSSNAVNATIRKAMQVVVGMPVKQIHPISSSDSWKSLKWGVSLLVIIAGSILPLFYKKKQYRTIQLCLNVVVLGFWSGTFISHSLIINYLSNGANILQSLLPLFLLVIAFIYPLLGKPKHYCMWVCPFGSIQELVGKCVKNKRALSPGMLNHLKRFHEGLWVLLMLLMWSGICFSWMNYELFSAFLFSQASAFVIAAAVLFVGLSLFVQRPYCRFVCPTGYLFHITQDIR